MLLKFEVLITDPLLILSRNGFLLYSLLLRPPLLAILSSFRLFSTCTSLRMSVPRSFESKSMQVEESFLASTSL